MLQATIYCRALIGRDGHIDQSEAYDMYENTDPRTINMFLYQLNSTNGLLRSAEMNKYLTYSTRILVQVTI